MANLPAHTISHPVGDIYDDQIAWVKPASHESVGYILSLCSNQDLGETRSQWVWVRLVSGDLILGVFPQDDAYFHTEGDHSS